MAKRTWQALVLGHLPEARAIFSRPILEKELPTNLTHVPDPADFEEALQKRPKPDVILIDVEPHGTGILEMVREHFPVSPVIMVGDTEHAPALLASLRKGLERHEEVSVNIISQVVYRTLQHSVEPPSMEMPSAEQMHRYAQYHHILHPFVVAGPQGSVLYVNAAAERMTWKVHGRSPTIGESVADGIFDFLGDAFARQYRDALDGRESVIQYAFDELEEPQERSVHCTPLQTSAGRTVAASVSVHQQLPPEVARTRTMRAIGRFAGGLAHDFNNLLNVMMVQSELLHGHLGQPSEPIERSLASIARAVSQGSALTRQLLAINHESMTYKVQVWLNPLLEALEPKLRSQLRGAQTLEFELGEDLPPISADPQQVEQLVTNLVENAVDALGDEGAITVDSQVFGGEIGKAMPGGLDPRRWVVLGIKDTGPGVRPSLHSTIFEPFFTTRRGHGHSGLGLTIVHAIVEQIGGRIFIDSEPGEGCLFRVFLPAADAAQTPAEPASPAESAVDELARPKLLLVEDEDDLRLPFQEALVQRGFDVLAAEDVSSALAVVDEHGEDIDVLITDVIMPGGSGVDLVRDVVARHADIKVVFISGYTAEVLGDTSTELDADYVFLGKPLSLNRLVEAVDRLLEDDESANGDHPPASGEPNL